MPPANGAQAICSPRIDQSPEAHPCGYRLQIANSKNRPGFCLLVPCRFEVELQPQYLAADGKWRHPRNENDPLEKEIRDGLHNPTGGISYSSPTGHVAAGYCNGGIHSNKNQFCPMGQGNSPGNAGPTSSPRGYFTAMCPGWRDAEIHATVGASLPCLDNGVKTGSVSGITLKTKLTFACVGCGLNF